MALLAKAVKPSNFQSSENKKNQQKPRLESLSLMYEPEWERLVLSTEDYIWLGVFFLGLIYIQ